MTLLATPATPPQPAARPRRRRQQATCPTCGRPVPGLLAGCDGPVCRTADLDYDAAIDRRDDI